MIIREMGWEDIERVAELEAVSFSVPWSAGMLNDTWKNPAATCLLAMEGEELLGYCALMVVLDEGELCRLGVFPEFKRRGVGSALIDRMIEFMQGQGVHVISLEVRENNLPAISLYEKKGFRRIGLRKNYYKKPLENGLTMQREC